MEVRFLATLPPIKSAILIDGMGDGGQIKLEVGRESRDALLALGEMAGQMLEVVVRPAMLKSSEGTADAERQAVPAGGERKSGRATKEKACNDRSPRARWVTDA